MSGLGRVVPPDWRHFERFPLSGLAPEIHPRGIPVIAGVNWYREFDAPTRDLDGRWWVAKDGKLTDIRGGHCFCIKANEPDRAEWWQYYNQGLEGACVGFGSARALSDLRQVRYDAFELYHATQALGGYEGQEGAFVRDAMEVLRTRGASLPNSPGPDSKSRIAAYRWTRSVDDVLAVLTMHLPGAIGGVPFLNSWGTDYPHVTWMPLEVLDRLMKEDGEIAIVTDR